MKSDDLSRKYKIPELHKLVREFPESPKPADYPFVSGVVEGFASNIARSRGLIVGLPSGVHFGMVAAMALALAANEATGGNLVEWWNENDPNGLSGANFKLAEKKFPKQYERMVNWSNSKVGKEISPKHATRLWKMSLLQGGTEAVETLGATLSAALISAWTAFEVLVGDLWEHALNSRLSLVFIALEAEPDSNDDPDTKAKKENKTTPFLLRKLREPDFDAKTGMGTLLREQPKTKWDFARRNEAREIFIKTFPDSKTQLGSLLDDPVLKWLCESRNLLVHQGGRVNTKFWQAVREHPDLRDLEIGEQFIPTGKLLDELVRGMTVRAKELLIFVNDWIKNNPQ